MLYYFILHIILLLLLGLYSSSNTRRGRNTCRILVIFVLVYFATYRDGLGMDYAQYVRRLQIYNTLESLVLGVNEPLFSLIGYIISNTFLSPIFLFFIASFVTCSGIVGYFFRNSEVTIWSVLIFVLLATMYCQSFNIVRQYFAVGVFFYSLRYIGKSIPKYFACIATASLMHMSAAILFPFYWVLQLKITRAKLIPLFFVLIILSILALSYISGADIKYASNANEDQEMKSSSMIILWLIIFIGVCLNKKLYYQLSKIDRNLMVFYAGTVSMSLINYYFYRLSYFFFPVMAIIIPRFLYYIDKRNRLNTLFIAFLCVLFYFILFSKIDDPLVVPSKILPASSIFDSYYKNIM